MIRYIRPALILAAVAAVAVAAAVPAIAAAPGPKGTLTTVEYQQLNLEQVAFKKLRHDKHLTWKQLDAACQTVGRSTDLLAVIRSNCQTGIGLDRSLVGFYADLERCAALSTTTGTTTTGTTTTGTTTTGTTTTGTTTTATGTSTTGTTTTPGGLSATDFKLLACTQPEYAVIARAFKALDAGQVALRAQVLDRDFTGRCLLTLAPTTVELRDLKHVVATAKQLSADIEQISLVAAGSAPASSVNGSQVEADSTSFNAAARTFELVHRPQKLSVCPHQ